MYSRHSEIVMMAVFIGKLLIFNLGYITTTVARYKLHKMIFECIVETLK